MRRVMLCARTVLRPKPGALVLGNPYEYLRTAREVDDIGVLLTTYVSRIPYASDDNWVTHVAGHPPGMLLFFVALVRLGLGSDFCGCTSCSVSSSFLLRQWHVSGTVSASFTSLMPSVFTTTVSPATNV